MNSRIPAILSDRDASAAAAARVSTPSFSKTCSRCLFTVRGLMPRMSPVSGLVLPLATLVLVVGACHCAMRTAQR